MIGLGYSPFARHYSGNLIDFSSSGYLDVSVPPLARVPSCSTLTRHYSRWVPPFGNPRIKACLTAPRGLSQPDCALLRLLAPGHPPYALSSFPRLLSRRLRDFTCSVRNVPRGLSTTSASRDRPHGARTLTDVPSRPMSATSSGRFADKEWRRGDSNP